MIPWQQLGDALCRMALQTREDVGKPGLRIDVVEARSHDERDHHGGALGAAIRTCEQPSFSSESQATQASFCRIVRQADSSILSKAGEVAPPLKHVVDGLGDR
jgi:hypothetical protein